MLSCNTRRWVRHLLRWGAMGFILGWLNGKLLVFAAATRSSSIVSTTEQTAVLWVSTVGGILIALMLARVLGPPSVRPYFYVDKDTFGA
jgi:hypothetical protein